MNKKVYYSYCPIMKVEDKIVTNIRGFVLNTEKNKPVYKTGENGNKDTLKFMIPITMSKKTADAFGLSYVDHKESDTACTVFFSVTAFDFNAKNMMNFNIAGTKIDVFGEVKVTESTFNGTTRKYNNLVVRGFCPAPKSNGNANGNSNTGSNFDQFDTNSNSNFDQFDPNPGMMPDDGDIPF